MALIKFWTSSKIPSFQTDTALKWLTQKALPCVKLKSKSQYNHSSNFVEIKYLFVRLFEYEMVAPKYR